MKPRNISFAMTTSQIQDKSKDVTRRDGWLNVKAGDLLRPVDRVMGFKKGERPTPLLPNGELIQVVSVRREPLSVIDQADVVREGFPELTRKEFIAMYRKHGDKAKDRMITRIEFRYVGATQ